MPEKSESRFEREEILNVGYDSDGEVNYVAVQPLKDYSGESKEMPLKLSCMDSNGTTLLGEIDVLYDSNARKTTDVYIISPNAELDGSTVIIAESDEFINTFEVNVNSDIELFSEQQKQLAEQEEQMQAEIARQKAEQKSEEERQQAEIEAKLNQ